MTFAVSRQSPGSVVAEAVSDSEEEIAGPGVRVGDPGHTVTVGPIDLVR